ncbi:MAG TPA: tRNA uridine-5-carboxymethylaminomethyl(34) synthesis enzyme MnmG [Candidatus Faecenecus gallistercoris]|uniref:tRNA uridine 5-carboxymethylaminomethyl modification enzyme MnmG n=1 Tax=Candidatus Faecenecus gallistercoris TaxID=2840793 RepID=A0A9D1CJM2_9FIRM|nr:tRNA uridine-5-carboxymethylaminomethyl(34) synthesis enzyme MnmG [Candidatus Faecenecus gallistercoris]
MDYEVVVVGGGHAGCEACLATARKGHRTVLVTGNFKNVGDMPCNPSIGGPAKGIFVREIDALGGEMAKVIDSSSLQMKLLNTKKGPAVQALRAQADKITYPKMMQEAIQKQENLDVIESLVENLIVEDHKVCGVVLEDGREIRSKIVILTTGTYLKACILVGSEKTSSGPHGERPSHFLSDHLKELGFRIQRLKTGTPPRIERSSIDFSKASLEPGDSVLHTFSFDEEPKYKVEDQLPCYLIYTNQKTHDIIKAHLNESSMYGGYVSGVGPRYCPSIEDKVVRFADKERHQLFLEPESRYFDDIYIQGFSTSMPHSVQEEMVHSLEGLEHAKILRYAYAIEYDAIDPLQLQPSLETKLIEGLFTAGQINGTSGYEEAAAQGLMAGINASLKLEGKAPLILKRNEAYIGVLIDDLVTKGTKEPYRMLTSRAEYRLLLRHDNADLRLRDYGYQVGLIDEERYQKFLTKKKNIDECIQLLKDTKVTPTKENNEYLASLSSAPILDGVSLLNLLKRPEIKIVDLKHFIDFPYSEDILEQVEITVKYEGYINKELKEANRMMSLENILIPSDIDYQKIVNIASEARQKLELVRPISIGQASRISGVNPADIAVLTVYLKKLHKGTESYD